MPDDYTYDVFLSYRRANPVGDWVHNHFHPLLAEWLPQVMPRDPKLFIDTRSIETADDWPLKLQQALRGSRCVVAVWSANYFRSPWCVAEWRSMLKREEKLGYRTEDRTRGLVYPVVFFDGEHFPSEAKRTQSKDLRRWSNPDLSFRNTQDFLGFTQEIKTIAGEIWEMVDQAPPWQPDWPIIIPDQQDETISVTLPRLQ